MQRKMNGEKKVFELMIDEDYAPDTCSYNIIMDGYCSKRKRLDEAMKLFHEVSH